MKFLGQQYLALTSLIGACHPAGHTGSVLTAYVSFILLNNVTVINPNKNADKPIQIDLNLFFLFSVSFFHSLPYALIITLKLGFCNTF